MRKTPPSRETRAKHPRWQRWVDAPPSLFPLVLLGILWLVTFSAGGFSLGVNCPRTGPECGLTYVVTIGTAALELAVLSPWLAAWWARRARDARIRARQQGLEPYVIQLRGWLAQGLVGEDEYRTLHERLRAGGGPDAAGENALAVARFLRTWAALLFMGGFLAVVCVLLFFLEIVDLEVLLPPLGLALLALIGVTLLLSIAGGTARAVALAKQRSDFNALDHDLEELAIRTATASGARKRR